ncbi:MAG: hypothetical protein WCQ67_08640 [Treponema sp.]
MKKYLLLFILLLTIPLYSQEINFGYDTRLTDEITFSNELSAYNFIKTSLVASGASDDEITNDILKLQNLFLEFKNELNINNIVENEQSAEYALNFLYEKLFTSYSINQTKVNVTINSGIYNCVSSTIIYMYFIKSLGITVSAVETPKHSFCTLSFEDKQIDVETTNPYGFNPGVKKDISTNTNQKKYAVVPAKDYYGRKDIDDNRIMALIYNNRIAALQKQKNDKVTIPLAIDAMKLQNYSEPSISTFQMCVLNTAIDLSLIGKNEEGIDVVLTASEKFGNCKLYSSYIEASVGKIINAQQKNNQYEDSFSTLEKYKSYIGEEYYSELLNGITINFLNYKITNSTFEDSYNSIKEKRNSISNKDYEKLLSLSYCYEAEKISKDSGYIEAWKFLEKSNVELTNNYSINNQIKVYKQNYAITVHNKAAKLVNDGDKSFAKKEILLGLENVSDSSILQNDLKRLDYDK